MPWGLVTDTCYNTTKVSCTRQGGESRTNQRSVKPTLGMRYPQARQMQSMEQSRKSTDTIIVVGRRGKKESPNTGRGLVLAGTTSALSLPERCNLAASALMRLEDRRGIAQFSSQRYQCQGLVESDTRAPSTSVFINSRCKII